MTVPELAPTTFSLPSFRRLRFGAGVQCPRCLNGRVHRWGEFAGRRRYRCLACGRTFSDLTGTPMAYLKRLDRWDPFCGCVVGSRTIRWTAARLGVHPSTAFRWRHRMLAGLQARDRSRLEGVVDLGQEIFPYSEKGSRRRGLVPRRRARAWPWPGHRVWVLLATDQRGGTLAEAAGEARPTVEVLGQLLLPRMAPDAIISDRAGPYGAAARLARGVGIEYRRRAPLPWSDPLLDGPDLHPLARLSRSLRVWLEPFRGVATRYLNHYLNWHRFLHALSHLPTDAPGARAALLVAGCARSVAPMATAPDRAEAIRGRGARAGARADR